MINVQANRQDHQVGYKPGDALNTGIFLAGVCLGSLRIEAGLLRPSTLHAVKTGGVFTL
jgi:hypothetical protein